MMMFRSLLSRRCVAASPRCLFSDQPGRFQSYQPRQFRQAPAEQEFVDESPSTDASEFTPKRSFSSSRPFTQQPAATATAPTAQGFRLEAAQAASPFPEESLQSYDMDSFPGISGEPFAPEIGKVLMTPLADLDVEIKPDGAVYLPE